MLKKCLLILILFIFSFISLSFAISGKITKISESGEKVIINIGSDDGISNDDEVTFYSKKNKKVAKGVVVKTNPSKSIVKITDSNDDIELTAGMIAKSKSSSSESEDEDESEGRVASNDEEEDNDSEEGEEEEGDEESDERRTAKTKSSGKTNFGACFVSFIFGPGAGEWLVLDSQTFGECCIEELLGLIPILGFFNWIGSMIDAYNEEPKARANWLFTTFDL